MNEDQYTEPDREELTRDVLQNIQVLVDTDVRGTARLILMDFPLELAEVSYKLHIEPAKQFNFLQGIFDPKWVEWGMMCVARIRANEDQFVFTLNTSGSKPVQSNTTHWHLNS